MSKTPVLLVPLITPLGPDGSPDSQALLRLAHDVLAGGAAGVVLFGTLGEAQSFSVAERCSVLEALLRGGVDPARVTVGTGAAALPDVVALSRHALAAGCVRQLLLPPFFFKGVSDEGLHRFIAAAIEGAGDPRLRLTLYDIPGLVSVAIAPDVVARLVAGFGAVIAGIKDSVPDWAHVEASLRRFPSLDIFVGNEIFLPQACALGGAGAISGLGNIAPRQMAALVAGQDAPDPVLLAGMRAVYDRVGRYPVVPTVKALTARARNEPALAAVRPPLATVDPAAVPDAAAAADAFLAIGV
jgi:4-hydroxy-tetrahydrodipicolinate synthase